jgi:nucleoside-diphosphate-sugar epimerase
MRKNFLLTGATGFFGSHLLKALLQNNFGVIILKRSFSDIFRIQDCLSSVKSYDIDYVDLESIFKTNQIDTVIHTATNYGRDNKNTLEIIKSNLVYPLELLDLGLKNNLARFINLDTTLPHNINEYALSKRQFYDWLKVFSKKLACINVSLEHFYGFQDSDSKFVTKIIRDLLTKIDKIDLTLGEQRRDFIYIDDAIEALMKIINNETSYKNDFTEFEIGSGHNISIKELVLLIKNLSYNQTTKLNFGAVPYRENEIMESRADISKILALGWQQKTTLEHGLKKTIDLEKEILK